MTFIDIPRDKTPQIDKDLMVLRETVNLHSQMAIDVMTKVRNLIANQRQEIEAKLTMAELLEFSTWYTRQKQAVAAVRGNVVDDLPSS